MTVNSHRFYIGTYLTVQYLEDCGLLDLMISGKVCGHFRVFRDRVYFRLARDLVTKKDFCTECRPEQIDLKVFADYTDERNQESHLFCGLFEHARLPFALMHDSVPRLLVGRFELKLARILQLKEMGALESVLMRRRCPVCLAKTSSKPCCTIPKEASKTIKMGETTAKLESEFLKMALQPASSPVKAKVCKTSQLSHLGA